MTFTTRTAPLTAAQRKTLVDLLDGKPSAFLPASILRQLRHRGLCRYGDQGEYMTLTPEGAALAATLAREGV